MSDWLASWLESLLLVFCTLHVSVAQRGYEFIQSEPTQGAVHPYPWVTPPKPEVGPFVAIFLSTKSDLESLSKERTHHLYFQLLPCSQDPNEFDLFSGEVFAATEEERARHLRPDESSENRLFKVYIPTDLRKIVKQTSIWGELDVPKYLETARRDGLCVRVGGGKMWTFLFSNVERVPIVIRDNEIVAADENG